MIHILICYQDYRKPFHFMFLCFHVTHGQVLLFYTLIKQIHKIHNQCGEDLSRFSNVKIVELDPRYKENSLNILLLNI